MENLKKQELMNITGGGISIGVGILIGAAITFVIGVIDGYVRPKKCN